MVIIKVFFFSVHVPSLFPHNSGPDGKLQVTFGTLFNDDRCANIFEALVGTLRAAKRKKIVSYEGELLLQGVHDKVVISLL